MGIYTREIAKAIRRYNRDLDAMPEDGRDAFRDLFRETLHPRALKLGYFERSDGRLVR